MQPAFRILGPLEVDLSDERVVALGRRERAVLGVLLLNAGEVVGVERLIDDVWGESPPSSAKHMVHEYVSRLRIALGDASRIETRAPGYVVTCADGELDSRLFSGLTAAARTAASDHDHARALRSYEEALALWRGEALAGVQLEGRAQIDVARLDEERRLVAEESFDSALSLGRHRELIPELERRVRDEPLRERPRAQLMLALYRAGRQADALERYREGRTMLVEHAGIEPGPELRGLERAILRQDPALDAAPRPRTRERMASVTPARRRWTRAAGVSGALLAVALAVTVFAVGRSGSGHGLARIDASSAGAIDPGSNRLVDQVGVGAGPGRVAAGFGSLWVVNAFDSTVSRIDPVSGNVQQTITVDADPTAIVAGAGFVWVACTGSRSVDRIDPRLNRPVQRVPVGNGPSGLALGSGAVWVTNRLDDSVSEIDAKTGDVRRRLAAGAAPSDIAYGLGALWIANESSSSVTRLDPHSGELQEVGVGNGPESVAIADGAVWVANSLDGTVSRIDPASNTQSAVIGVGPGPSAVLASEGAIWVADSYGSEVVRIDPATNDVVRRIAIGSRPQSLASIGGRVWVSARAATGTHRGGTLRIFDVIPAVPPFDAALGYANAAVGDGLVGFKRVGGLDGGSLVPDLATSLPRPTNGGRTYAFQLHRGIRYSNGDPLRASDVRRALERDFRLGSPGVIYYGGLIGAKACSKSRCDLSRGVVTDDLAGTVTLHLGQPDPEFLYKLAQSYAEPVPPRVSLTKPARLGTPGTGPYMIQSYGHSKLVLVRNPHFRQWSAAAQPDGYPDKLISVYGGTRDQQLTAVEHGKADLMRSPPAPRLDEVTSRYAAQVHVFPAARTYALFLNTRVPPFNNLAARRALNYAIDRSKASAGFGEVDARSVTCQILPAGTPAYRPYCPYTLNPTSHGVWTGPDIPRALRLVAASGTRGQKVTFWTGPLPFELAVGRLAVATLKRLGYRASWNVVGDDDKYFEAIYDSRTRAQAGFMAWQADYPAASSFFAPLFTCRSFQPGSVYNLNAPEICNRRLDQAVDQALSRQTTDALGASNATWSAVDRLVTDLAPWVPIANTRDVMVVSRRVGNVQANTQWGVLEDQIWVR